MPEQQERNLCPLPLNELYHQKVKILPEEETTEEEEQKRINHKPSPVQGSILGHFRCCLDRDGLNVH